jgi:hypothetical protein
LLLLLLLCKRIEAVLRHNTRLLCGKLAVFTLTEATKKERRNIASI